MISQFTKKLQLKFVDNQLVSKYTEIKKEKLTRRDRYIPIITVEILTYFSQYLIK